MKADEATRYRRNAARINFLAQDRPDLSFAACVASQRMAHPRCGDELLLKRTVRFMRTCR